MTSSRTALVTALALLLSAGCSYSINGDALPQAGVTPTTSAEPSDGPKIAKPRTVVGVEPCSLLTAADLKAIGPYKKEPARKDDVIQESCQYVLDDGSQAGRTVVAALYQKYEQVRTRQSKGREVVVEGHSTWTLCELSGGEMACTATLAVNANRSVLVAMAQAGGEPEQMLAGMQPLLKAALNRLPIA
ncbi:DUF3558 family protein [Saccharothrix luteola]|uniref:DUF3558 family protein n=1 Tax=Saccharothrix luteola TaxID=2893018 RepID=UPI001E632873|nr:DUF3558 family protein [Saccharothrix luteola]MCC8243851.1 DUF3558 domain-containing protein [Saccharothrix luteola]